MKVLFIVLGMAVVTYTPRLLPALFMHRLRLPARFEAWLQSIPYAALGALIFPGILLVDRDRPEVGLTGGLVAAFLAYCKAHIIVVMAGAIGSVLLLQNWNWLF